MLMRQKHVNKHSIVISRTYIDSINGLKACQYINDIKTNPGIARVSHSLHQGLKS